MQAAPLAMLRAGGGACTADPLEVGRIAAAAWGPVFNPGGDDSAVNLVQKYLEHCG